MKRVFFRYLKRLMKLIGGQFPENRIKEPPAEDDAAAEKDAPAVSIRPTPQDVAPPGMEDLFIYALLAESGCIERLDFMRVLENLFLENPEDSDLLDLVWRPEKDAPYYTISLMDKRPFDRDRLVRVLLSSLKPVYLREDLYAFNNHMSRLLNLLPDNLGEEEPFTFMLNADEYLFWEYSKDEEENKRHARRLYEKALNYYED